MKSSVGSQFGGLLVREHTLPGESLKVSNLFPVRCAAVRDWPSSAFVADGGGYHCVTHRAASVVRIHLDPNTFDGSPPASDTLQVFREGIPMAAKWSVGSRWLRWDPHIHAPGTLLNNQFGNDSWPAYLRLIETTDPSVVALGITDYFTMRSYCCRDGWMMAL